MALLRYVTVQQVLGHVCASWPPSPPHTLLPTSPTDWEGPVTHTRTHKNTALTTLARCVHRGWNARKCLLQLGEALVNNRISRKGQVQVQCRI